MAVNLFDLLKDIFASKDITKIYSDQELKNCGFSVQRIMSIKYPVQANSQNVLGTNMANVVRYWAINMEKKYTRLPQWATIATAKLRKEYQSKIGEIDLPKKEIVDAFVSFHSLDDREFQFLLKGKTSGELLEMMKAFEQNYGI